ncbi:MAG: hypothetical protein LBV43_12065 [Prevotella sp.]|jgi:hypothetical protein|nr:hypothetical protein [Prevotella sp.]
MKFKNILILIFLVCVSFSVDAQNRPNGRQGNPERGGFDMEAMRKEKGDFLIKELNLTDAEAKAFLPLEFEFMEKKFEVNRDTRHKTWEIKRKENKTEADYKKMTDLNLEANKKEADLQIEYFKKFAEVLPAQKIEKYRSADLKFKEEMLKKHQERKDQGQPDRQRQNRRQ